MEKGTFIMWLFLTIMQTIILVKEVKLNKILEEEIGEYIDRRLYENRIMERIKQK